MSSLGETCSDLVNLQAVEKPCQVSLVDSSGTRIVLGATRVVEVEFGYTTYQCTLKCSTCSCPNGLVLEVTRDNDTFTVPVDELTLSSSVTRAWE